jgi:ParB family chromosome partitioning protein
MSSRAARTSDSVCGAESAGSGVSAFLIGVAEASVLIVSSATGWVPLSVAMQISTSDDAGIQQALCDAYENKTLRGRKLLTVRKIIEQRKTKGKRLNQGPKPKEERAPTAEALVRVYRQEADRQKDTVRKARLTENRLLFIVTALKQLFRDENFVTLMRAEQMEMLPAYLAERIQATEKG